MIEGGEMEFTYNGETKSMYVVKSVFNEKKYKILKKGGKNYISLVDAEKGERKGYPTYDFEIRKLEKNSFMMVCDKDFTEENEKGETEVTAHIYMTIISN